MKILVKVKPNAKLDAVTKDGEALFVKTKGPPQEGRANKAVIKLLSKYFNVPQSSIRIVSGIKSKNKIIEITDS